MSDLIKREDVYKAIEVEIKVSGEDNAEAVRQALQSQLDNLAGIPSADRPQGEWIKKEHGYRCTACNLTNDGESLFCPQCGAKMKGVDE